MKRAHLSIVVPIYNEEKNLPILVSRLQKTIKKIGKSNEIIFVDDGSKDNSLKILKTIQKKSRNIKIVSFSRNFGHMAAIDAGLSHSNGEYVVLMDGDLQDPPEEIFNLYKKAKTGFKVVYGVKEKRKENVFRRLMFNNFYKVLYLVSDYKMPLNAGTFSIMHREVIDILLSMPEKNKYFSGLRAWAGFSQTGHLYERDMRFAGKPASFRRLFKLAFDGIFSFSYFPLKLASFMGFFFALISFLFIVIVAILRVFFSAGILGWASTLSVILFIGGIQLITLGIIGEYLSRIYDEVKGRPKYVIQSKFGLK